MPHVVYPKSGKTLVDSYGAIGYTNAQGHTECVEFIKQVLHAPPTGAWREGKKIVKGVMTVTPGTAIATFVAGKYPQSGNTGMHAAIYLGQNAEGIQVMDQWRSQGEVRTRTIPWTSHRQGLSNNGSAFSIIEW